jgi:16S rRNA (cytosine967-C5)-methyltransferase
MRLGGRIVAAAEVLADMAARHRPVAEALKDWGLSHRFAGSGDRAAIGNLVYDALRRKLSLSWRMGDETPLGLVTSVLLDGWGESEASLREKLDGDRFAPELPSAQSFERFVCTNIANAPLHVQSDVPEWTLPVLQSLFGDEMVQECVAMTRRPPVDIRVNRLLSTREKVMAELPRHVGALDSVFTEDGIRIPAGDKDYRQPNIQAEPAFQKGWFEIQDKGSQIVTLLAGVKPGQSVMDYCAGGGGKTLALASALQNKGQIFATDSDKVRLAPIFDRLKRAETRNVQVMAAKSDLSDLVGAMDCVLIDAPCTGAGTWRRRPDAKWRLSSGQLAQRVTEQAGILETAKVYVKPGGRLVYITCSLFPAENIEQIDRFIAENSNFSALAPAELVSSTMPSLPLSKTHIGENGLSLTPYRTDTDGFFISVLQRN